MAYGVGIVGYAVGLWASTALDWPSGPVIVWTLCLVALIVFTFHARTSRGHQP